MEDTPKTFLDKQYQYSISVDSLSVVSSTPDSGYSYHLTTEKQSNRTVRKPAIALHDQFEGRMSATNHRPEDVSFRELITLACQNKPNFYALFQERYPQLHQRLLATVFDLRLSELTLCAYIYMDFSAKDISRYTFKSVRTIQARKSHLRKRLSIPSSEDIYIWMKNLNSPDFKNPENVVG